MRRFLFSRTHEPIKAYQPFDKKQIERAEARLKTLDDLRDATGMDVLAKAVIMQNKFPKDFAAVVEQYKEIFEQVEEIQVGPLSQFEKNADTPPFLPMEWLTVALRERGVKGWLVHQRVSSGMLRTLFHLLELSLAPSGTVVLIDEFENSLGANCLPNVAEHILSRANDLQFFITSHHPYVINKFPAREWHVVLRNGSAVRVLTAAEIPALQTSSMHDAFTILSNISEFERGIQ
jgi:predicted ATPase